NEASKATLMADKGLRRLGNSKTAFAEYYIRKSPSSSKWIVFLEGKFPHTPPRPCSSKRVVFLDGAFQEMLQTSPNQESPLKSGFVHRTILGNVRGKGRERAELRQLAVSTGIGQVRLQCGFTRALFEVSAQITSPCYGAQEGPLDADFTKGVGRRREIEQHRRSQGAVRANAFVDLDKQNKLPTDTVTKCGTFLPQCPKRSKHSFGCGWFCFDQASCAERRRLMPDFMSSRKWPRHRKGTGILSWDPEENPYHYQANMVLIPYCSSDSWSGTKNKTKSEDFAFMGSLIVEEVIKKLMKKGLRKAKKLMLTGSSAGGTGVLVNIDRVAELVRTRAPQVEVRGLVDAGWFLDNEPYRGRPCHNAYSCSPIVSVQRGIQMWEPRLPEMCQAQYASEPWRCYFGHRLYPTLQTPVYIVQNLYDAAQIKVDNVFDENRGSDLSRDQWRYLLQLGEQVKATLLNTSAVFAPSCVSHDVLLNSEWHKLSIDGITLSQSIYCWEENGATFTSPCHHSRTDPARPDRIQTGAMSRNDTPLADAPPSSEAKPGRQTDADRSRRETDKASGSQCRKHLLDRCPWPHCNCSCPRCRWPATMNEVNQYFMKSLASVMDIDPQKMENVQLCGY
ncbi:hypothetical protein BaRGS_00035796, partial [Batillaria attramentaria]